MTARPTVVVAVVGTATEVGKTWVAARLIEQWRGAGLSVAARKPVQSHEPGDDDRGVTDAAVLGAASGEPPAVVCLPARSYPVALAPPMAASVLGRAPIQTADLLSELRWPASADVGVVETAGGLRSPQSEEADALELTAALGPDLTVLVSDAGLGAINAVRLCADVLLTARLRFVTILNRFDETDGLHVSNFDWLTERRRLDVVTSTPGGLTLAANWVAARARAR